MRRAGLLASSSRPLDTDSRSLVGIVTDWERREFDLRIAIHCIGLERPLVCLLLLAGTSEPAIAHAVAVLASVLWVAIVGVTWCGGETTICAAPGAEWAVLDAQHARTPRHPPCG